jgi:hypothetical protein
MKTEQLTFEPTKAGKWNYLATNTGSMVNAGVYLVRMVSQDTKDLTIDGLDVQ